jgi:hypothetical protein
VCLFRIACLRQNCLSLPSLPPSPSSTAGKPLVPLLILRVPPPSHTNWFWFWFWFRLALGSRLPGTTYTRTAHSHAQREFLFEVAFFDSSRRFVLFGPSLCGYYRIYILYYYYCRCLSSARVWLDRRSYSTIFHPALIRSLRAAFVLLSYKPASAVVSDYDTIRHDTIINGFLALT